MGAQEIAVSFLPAARITVGLPLPASTQRTMRSPSPGRRPPRATPPGTSSLNAPTTASPIRPPSRRLAVPRRSSHASAPERVRAGGLEPPRVTPPGPKPGASASSATLARTFYLGIRLVSASAHRSNLPLRPNLAPTAPRITAVTAAAALVHLPQNVLVEIRRPCRSASPAPRAAGWWAPTPPAGRCASPAPGVRCPVPAGARVWQAHGERRHGGHQRARLAAQPGCRQHWHHGDDDQCSPAGSRVLSGAARIAPWSATRSSTAGQPSSPKAGRSSRMGANQNRSGWPDGGSALPRPAGWTEQRLPVRLKLSMGFVALMALGMAAGAAWLSWTGRPATGIPLAAGAIFLGHVVGLSTRVG